jgi:hypothetical protein
MSEHTSSKFRQRRNDFGCNTTTMFFAYSIQEPWLIGSEISKKLGYYIIKHGLDSKSNREGRTCGGVAIILSPAAVWSWITAGLYAMQFGNCILAVKLNLEMEDLRGNQLQRCCQLLKLPSRLQKKMSRTLSQSIQSHIMDHLMEAANLCKIQRSSPDLFRSQHFNGISHSREGSSLGPFGIEIVNSAGRSLHGHFDAKGMCSADSFFPKPTYGSW